jgi:hypothetical protein
VDAHLYVNIIVDDIGFATSLEFKRIVYYSYRGHLVPAFGTTWNMASAGNHASNPNFIVQSLDTKLDSFLNEYLKANGQ